jgi:hypothetical protein
MNSSQARGTVHEAISSVVPFGDPDEDDTSDAPDAGYLIGWCVVAEWQGADGHRWLSKMSGDTMGEKALPTWQERGYLNEAANHWE